VQSVTSSVVYSSGSNVFGNDIGNSQRFTGSVLITGSLTIAGASSATSYSGVTIFGSTIACSPIGCFATSCATSFIGGTISGTTIYGSTVVCSPVGKFTSCLDLGGALTGTSATFSSAVRVNGAYSYGSFSVLGTQGLSWSSVGNDIAFGLATIGTATTGASLWVHTPAPLAGWTSGLGVDGTTDGGSLSTIQLTAYGLKFSGYNSKLALRTTSGTTITNALVLDGANSGAATFSSTITGTTIYGSTAVCSPVGKFTSCVTAASLRIDNNSNLIGNGRRIFGNDDATNYYIGDIGGGGALDINWYGAIKLMTAYGEVMRITSAGNVGIGTCTPTGTYGKLSVAGGISILNNNCAKLEIGRYSSSSTDSYIVMASGSTGLTFTNAGDVADVMRITTGGNVGIGVSSPSVITGVNLIVKALSSAGNGYIQALSSDSCTSVALYSGIDVTDDPAIIFQRTLRFGTSTNSLVTGFSEKMRITNEGRVGIGSEPPSYGTLSIFCTDNTVIGSPEWGTSAACNLVMAVYNGSQCAGSAAGIRFITRNSGAAIWNILNISTGASTGDLAFGNGTGGSGTEKMRITNAGHLQKPCSAAFHAAINASTCVGLGGRIIQFNCVIYNAGGGYDGTTSTFTAPVSGMYQFNFTFLNQNVQCGDGGHAYLSTNFGVGTYYFTRYGNCSGIDRTGYGNYVPMHGAVAIYLPSGCKACVGAFWNADGAFTHNSTAWSNFTGYLVG